MGRAEFLEYVKFMAVINYNMKLREGDGFSDLVATQKAWALETLGPGDDVAGILKHIEKEIKEIQAAPHDVEEWIDIIILAMEGAWRSGASPQEVEEMLAYKLEKNRQRKWPDKGSIEPGQPIEHIKGFVSFESFKDGEPCPHPGCLAHLGHACEGCGRIGGKAAVKPGKPKFGTPCGHDWCIRPNISSCVECERLFGRVKGVDNV